MKSERQLWYIVALIGLISCLGYMDKLLAEPLKLTPTGCANYADDAAKIAQSRDAGEAEEATKERLLALPYHADVRPHLVNLIHFIFTSSLTPEEAAKSLYNECLKNEGKIGESM